MADAVVHQTMNKPPRDKWHVYKDGSPGFARQQAGITLTYIQAVLKASMPNHRTATRAKYVADGFLGRNQ